MAQSRPRVFIVGLRQERRTKKFRWPVPKLLPSLEFFLDRGSSNNPPDVPTTVTEQGNYLACVKAISHLSLNHL